VSAIVYIRTKIDEPLTADSFATRKVPHATYAEVREDGLLVLKGGKWDNTQLAVFKDWDHVVITPTRGADGKFLPKVAL
jgi:hypothetical protein